MEAKHDQGIYRREDDSEGALLSVFGVTLAAQAQAAESGAPVGAFQTTAVLAAASLGVILFLLWKLHTERKTNRQQRLTEELFTHIAKTLARGYMDFYYVDLDDETFIEYRTDAKSGEFMEARRGTDFFAACCADTERYVHPEDRDAVMSALERETLLELLERSSTFIMAHRLITERGPIFVSMRVSRMEDDDRSLIIAITDIDDRMKRDRAIEQMKEERNAFSRVNALAGDFICIYIVNPETERYLEYSASSRFESFEIPKEGTEFFENAKRRGRDIIYPDDLERAESTFTRENVFAEIERSGIFAMTYRLVLDGKPTYVRLKAAMVDEPEGRRLIVGINDVDAQIRQEKESAQRLANAQREANVDALTGVKNKHAYLEAEEQLDRQISGHHAPEFAVVILDVNDLKHINDTLGHQAGDEHIRIACKVVCDIFKHSPVFRIGGDEFAVIAQGNDYQCIDELVGMMSDHNREAAQSGGLVIACGMAKYRNEPSVATVFARADQSMYVNKSNLKATKENEVAE